LTLLRVIAGETFGSHRRKAGADQDEEDIGTERRESLHCELMVDEGGCDPAEQYRRVAAQRLKRSIGIYQSGKSKSRKGGGSYRDDAKYDKAVWRATGFPESGDYRNPPKL
jgi:hypothetical protein